MFKAANCGIILCLFVNLLIIKKSYCSTLVRSVPEAELVEDVKPTQFNLIKTIEDSINHEDFNSYPQVNVNMTKDQFGYSVYSGLVDYISHHLTSLVPTKYEPFDSNENFTATFGSDIPIEMEWHSTSRSSTIGNSNGAPKLISDSSLSDYVNTAEAMVNTITSQVASIAKRGLDSETDDVKWMMDNKQVQPLEESFPVQPVAASSARGLGQDIQSLISDKDNHHSLDLGHRHGLDLGHRQGLDLGHHHGLDLGRHHGLDLGHRHGLDLGRHHNQHNGLNLGHLPGLGKSHDDKTVFESVSGNFNKAIKNSVKDIGGEILSKSDLLHGDNNNHHHSFQHDLHQLGEHLGHHPDHHLGEHLGRHHDLHLLGENLGRHHDRGDDKSVFQSVSGALKDSIENISDGIGNQKKSSVSKNNRESLRNDNRKAISELTKTIVSLPQELNHPSLIKGPAKLVNSVLKTSIDTVKSSSKEMNTLGETINDSNLGSGLGKLIPGAIHAMGGGVTLGDKALEAVSGRDSKLSKLEDDPDASFYEDDDADSNNPGLFDGGKRRYFSKECRFRVACEIGKTVMSPMPSQLLTQYSDNKFMKDFQNKYTKAMTFGLTRKACDRYYCVFVEMMGGPGPFAKGVMELVLKKSA